ncbi:Lead, cadmium, zinc and mercury transporting ATPase; Copper-translocating P-type ATPase [hydrothermal vent metagenome]|uniref:Lead, cadmium, zinc and mercury transporting ATPase Copper-translocating P-type ATPase n=1 Tax=hydrothermal vent metagenome TaxID=652676 RepID=A0A3B0Y4S9_9ZZZZ
MKQKTDERSFKDPVCGMEISQITAIDEYEYEGKTYYFCASGCREAFEAEPGKYIRSHRQHGVK